MLWGKSSMLCVRTCELYTLTSCVYWVVSLPLLGCSCLAQIQEQQDGGFS